MLKVCGRLKGLILYRGLILPQSRESAKVQAQPYSSGAHRPCSAKAITRRFDVDSIRTVGVDFEEMECRQRYQ
jgi:hypothetical protein